MLKEFRRSPWLAVPVVAIAAWVLWPTTPHKAPEKPLKAVTAPSTVLGQEDFVMHYTPAPVRQEWISSGRPPIFYAPASNTLYFTPRPTGGAGNVPLSLRWPRSLANQHVLTQIVGAPDLVMSPSGRLIPAVWTFHAISGR